MLYIAGIIIVFLILILLWLNLSWAKSREDSSETQERKLKPPQNSKASSTMSEAAPTRMAHIEKERTDNRDSSKDKAVQGGAHDRGFRQGGSGEYEDTKAPSANRSPATPNSKAEHSMVSSFKAESETTYETERVNSETEKINDTLKVEVVDAPTKVSTPVFNRPPYHLNAVAVPEFSEPAWRKSFEFLTEHDKVLGWIAFRGNTVGASNQKYDEDFLEVLRSHRQITTKLQKHVGLSRIVETSVVGDEGKVWFITAVDDCWFALFVDGTVNGSDLTKKLLELQQPLDGDENPET